MDDGMAAILMDTHTHRFCPYRTATGGPGAPFRGGAHAGATGWGMGHDWDVFPGPREGMRSEDRGCMLCPRHGSVSLDGFRWKRGHGRTLTEGGLGGWFVPEGGECLCGGRGMGKMMREGKEGRGGKADTMAMRIRWRADAIPGGLRAGASARRGQWESWARRWSSLRERLGAPRAKTGLSHRRVARQTRLSRTLLAHVTRMSLWLAP